MPQLIIENFKYGVDARRLELATQPGALVRLENGHITQGGTIEKRNAFVLFAACDILTNEGDQGTFGLEVTTSGLVVFGSAYTIGGGSPQLLFAIPVGVTYVRLVHPAVSDGLTYDRLQHRMTALVCSTTYGGNSFAVAKFADGKYFPYINTTIVPEFRNGLVFAGLSSTSDIAAQCATVLEQMLSDFTVERVDNHIDLRAPATDPDYSLVASETSEHGSLNVETRATSGVGSNGVAANTVLKITNGTAGDQVDDILAPDGAGGTVSLFTNPVVWAISNNNTALLLAAEINNTIQSPKYTAAVSGNEVTVSAATSLGDSINTLNLTVQYTLTPGGTLSFDTAAVGYLTGSVNYTHFSKSLQSRVATLLTTNAPNNGEAIAIPSGGADPYTYQWQYSSGSSWIDCTGAEAVYPTAKTSASTKFRGMVQPDSAVVATFRCKITDGSGIPQVAYTPVVSVTLIIFPPEGK